MKPGKALFFLTVLILIPFGLAQDLPDPVWNPTEWFGSAAALAAVVAAAVAFLKRNVLRGLTGWVTVALSFLLAVGAAVVASFTSIYDAALLEAITFGASAGLLASGGWDAVRGLLGTSSSSETSTRSGTLPR